MGATKKIKLIIVLGIGASLLSFLFSRYLLELDHENKLVLLSIRDTKERVEHIRLLTKEFIQNGDQNTWHLILMNMEEIQANLQVTISRGNEWDYLLDGFKRNLNEYNKILINMSEPASKLKAEQNSLQRIGLTFSKEVEDNIIKPYMEEEGLQLYQGKSIDPFKARVKDTAHELIALHAKQQLVLLELFLSSDLDTYQKKKRGFSEVLKMHQARLKHMDLLLGNEPLIQSTIESLSQKLDIFVKHEQNIVEYFTTLTKLNSDLSRIDEKLLVLTQELSNKILADTQYSHRIHSTLTWAFLIIVIGGLGGLGSMLGNDIMQIVDNLKQSQKELSESEDNLMVTLNSIGDAVIVTDPESLVVRINPSAEQLTGWSSEEAVGKKLPEIFQIINGQTGEGAPNPVEKVIDEGKMVGLANDTILISKGGIEYQIADSAAPIRNEHGVVIGVVMVFRDVTETYTNAKKIKESEKLLRNITENVPGVFYQYSVTADHTYNFHFISEKSREIFGIEVSSGFPLDDIHAHIMDEDKDRFLTSLQESLDHLSDWHFEGRFKKPDGEIIWFSGNSVLYNNPEDQDETVFYGMFVDITERKLAEQENKKLESALKQSQKMEAIGTLAGGIAHDFNNILSAIIGFSQIGQRKAKDEKHLYVYFQNIQDAGLRAANLVKQILTFSRQSESEVMSLQVGVLIKEALQLLRPSIPANIEISQNISSNLDNVMADPTQIHQTIMNLCTNAVHAMQEKGGHLNIGLSQVQLNSVEVKHYPNLKPGSYLKLSIQDTGYGIPAENIEKIFDPYFTTKEKGKGTGLGLSVIHGIIRNYGGVIRVYSEVGRGSTFNVYLPTSKGITVSDTQSMIEMPRGNENIMLVDDEPALVELGEEMITSLGYKAIPCDNSIDALALFENAPMEIDLVISDMTMPKMNGDELATKMLKIRQDIPIIIYTGYNQNISEEKAAKIGVKALASKPLVMRDLAFLIREILDK